jgi:hypothetical protein
MFYVIRPTFEVVKEGRILSFVSGDRRFKFRGRKLTINGRIFLLTYPGKQIFALSLIIV